MAELEIKIPERFTPSDPAECVPTAVEPDHVYRHPETGDTFRIGAILLPSGQNIRWVAWSGGGRFASIHPDNDWAIEEHLDGEPPEHLRTGVDWAWKTVIDAMVKGNQVCREFEETAGG